MLIAFTTAASVGWLEMTRWRLVQITDENTFGHLFPDSFTILDFFFAILFIETVTKHAYFIANSKVLIFLI